MTHGRWTFATLVAVTASLAAAEPVSANPLNGTVADGTVHLGDDGTTVRTITQTTDDRAIINWQSFNIAKGETTQFVQPGTGAVALNRVIGGEGRSTIDGTLIANGGVWLVNPSGVLFGSNAQVNVHSLLATSADILDNDFMNGTFTNGGFAFSMSGNADASVQNNGTITLGDTGLAVLVAPHVRNEGTIAGQLATVVLAGAPTFTLDFNGDGLVQFAATSAVATAPDGAEALVENTGTIRTPGGVVLLTARAAADVIDNVINSGGIIEAQGVSIQDGRIVLDGGANGRVVVDGSLDVSPGEAGAGAGHIDIDGEYVRLDPTASLDASDGGTIAIRAARDLGINAAISQTGDTDISLDGKNVIIRRPVETDGTVGIRGKRARTEQTGIVAARQLNLTSTAGTDHAGGGGDVTLTTDVRELAIGKTGSSTSFGDVSIDNQGNLSVGVIDDNVGIEVGSLVLTTTGTLTVDQPVSGSNSGDAIVLAANRFVNQAGSTALQTPPPGRWLVYSRDPAADVRGALDGTLMYGLTFAGNPPASIATTGNAFLYAGSPPPLPPPAPPPPAPPPNLEPVLAVATIPINTEPLIQVNAPLASTQLTVEPPRLITVAPSDDGDGEDPLFASDGNRELWDLVSGR